jgi:(p)ppGpp synthase/HD superfamily hydrolase
VQLSGRFDAALKLASDLHRTQMRKSTDIPYLAHLMAVAGLVLEHGGTEDEAIAGLLHDAVEDQGGRLTLELIRREFGDEVADLVFALSDTDVTPKPPWRARKEEYLLHLEDAPTGVLRVSAADKLHNVRSIVAAYREIGERVWERFQGKRDGTLWYYRALLDEFQRKKANPLINQLQRAVIELEVVVAPAK